MVGFISGGNEASFPVSNDSSGNSIFLICEVETTVSTCLLERRTEPMSSCIGRGWRGFGSYLFIFELELQHHLVAIDGLLDNLGSHPALGGIGLPSSRPDIVALRHEDEGCWSFMQIRSLRLRGSQCPKLGGGRCEVQRSARVVNATRRDRYCRGSWMICLLKGRNSRSIHSNRPNQMDVNIY